MKWLISGKQLGLICTFRIEASLMVIGDGYHFHNVLMKVFLHFQFKTTTANGSL